MKVVELDPLSVEACHDLALTYLVMGQYDEAEKFFPKAFDLNPNWTWGYVKRAVTLPHTGNCAEASRRTEQSDLFDLMTKTGLERTLNSTNNQNCPLEFGPDQV